MRATSTGSKIHDQGTGPRAYLALLAGAILLVGLAGCRTRPAALAGTEVGPCDTLHGRLPVDRCSQGFTFEGVESSSVGLHDVL